MLFEGKKRGDLDPKRSVESDWRYLDRSGRREAERVRSFLEEWFSRYPEDHRAELKARMLAYESHDNESAAFEVVLFAALTSLGCVVQVHPPLEMTCRKPDFLCTAPDGDEFYVEAVLASEFREEQKMARRRSQVAIDALGGINTANWYISISESGQPDTLPPFSRLRNEVERWLATLDPEKVRQDLQRRGAEAAPKLQWEHGGWEVDIEAWPSQRDGNEPVVGARAEGMRCIEAIEPVRRAILAKAKSYGALPVPFLIAVNVDALFFDKSDEMCALFGDVVHTLLVGKQGVEPVSYRKQNGAWRDRRGPRYTRASGVWMFNNLSPWSAAHSDGTIYFHPCATRPLPELLRKVNHAHVGDDGKMQWLSGLSLREVLHLPQGWPA